MGRDTPDIRLTLEAAVSFIKKMKGYRHVHSFTSCGKRTMSADRSDERQSVKTDNRRRNVCWLCGLLVLVLLIVVLVTLLVCQFTTGSSICQRHQGERQLSS